ncbi:MAG: ABC transporter permease [Calditrichia bacterium]|nr:ABC transporter permease [Calditrichia bacterium]
MKQYFIRRAITLPIVLWGVVTIVFLLIHLIPGDPVDMMLGDNAPVEQVEQLREELGLNLPLPVMYKNFWINLFKGDLGKSIVTKTPVWTSLWDRLPNTALLAILSLSISIIFGIIIGVISGVYKNRWPDHLSRITSIIGVSMPVFWLGPLLMILFGVKLKWFHITGGTDFSHLVLPVVTLSLGLTAVTMRMMRAGMIDVLNQDYIMVARAKGLSNLQVIWKHALRNSLIPVVTVIGYQLGALLTGTVIVEYVFAYPGIGRLLIFSIMRRDYPMVQGVVLFVVIVYISVNLITDIVYRLLDARVKL